MRRSVFVTLALAAAVLVAYERQPEVEAGPPIIYVDADVAGGSGDGSSWANAYNSLWFALASHPEPAQFWVTDGTYQPLPLFPPVRAYRFVVGPGQELYGGFAGNETSLDQRGTGRSTLSGERAAAGPEDNFYNVLTVNLAGDQAAVIDGFNITAGYDERPTSSGGSAGGIVITGGKPLFRHIGVEKNWGQHGGGIHIAGGAPAFHDLFMHWNTRLSLTDTLGGISAAAGNVTIEDASLLGGPPAMEGTVVDFDGVTASISDTDVFSGESTTGLKLSDGNYSLQHLRVSTVRTALATASAAVTLDGAWLNDDEIAISTSGGNLTAVNVTFSDIAQGIVSGGPTTIAHSTFMNTGKGVGTVPVSLIDAIVQSDGSPAAPAEPIAVTRAIMDAACGGQVTCVDVLGVDPLLGPLAQPPVTETHPTGVFPLGIGSPAIDAGDSVSCPATDAALTLRPVDGDGSGDAACDLGAFELDPPKISFRPGTQAPEGAPSLTLLATIAGTQYTPATVDYRVLAGTATRDADYTLADGTLTFPVPDCAPTGVAAADDCTSTMDQPVTIVLRDDFLIEPTETVIVELANPTAALLGTGKRATARILDNEPRLKCAGVAATMVGSPAADVLRGTPGRDVIVGRGGNDRVIAAGGNDRICGGPGADRIRGGPGRDLLFGHGGDDALLGGGGNDELRGGGADDTLNGGGGNDVLLGQRGDDDIRGATGRDRLSGGPGAADTCDGGPGTDSLLPKAGCETIAGVP